MQSTKPWSYREATDAPERRIKQLMNPARPQEPDDARIYRQWAYGVFLGWQELTMGWQDDGDSERLEALTRAD